MLDPSKLKKARSTFHRTQWRLCTGSTIAVSIQESGRKPRIELSGNVGNVDLSKLSEEELQALAAYAVEHNGDSDD
jgi:hypothetical protein